MVQPQDAAAMPDSPSPKGFGLRILATTDLHMHLLDHNYYADTTDPGSGLVRTATLIRSARAEAEAAGRAVMLVDNGDFLQGTPVGEVSVSDRIQPHPMMLAFGHLGYDAVGLGNHDFDFGPDVLERALDGVCFPVISSNIKGADFISGCARLQYTTALGNLTVGVLSVLPPQTAMWNAHHLRGRITICDMVEAARRVSTRLREDGCDLVVALAHTGLSETPAALAENAAGPIAALDTVDVVVAGHTHQHLPGPAHAGMDGVDAARGMVHGTPVVMAGSAGAHLGLIDLDLDRDPDTGTCRISRARVDLRSIAQVPADPDLASVLAPAHDKTRAALNRPVGTTRRRLHSFFTMFGPDHGLAVTADAQVAAIRPAIRAAGLNHLPLLSAVAPSKFGSRAGPWSYSDVPEGPVTLRHVADLHVYRNELRVVQLTGAQVMDWLEMSARLFHQVPEGSRDRALMPDDAPGYNFDVIHGVTYRIDPSQPPRFDVRGDCLDPGARRVVDLRLGDAPLDPEQEVLVVANSYRIAGGGNFAALRDAVQVPVSPVELREAIAAHFRAGPCACGFAPPWRLADLPGTSVMVRTGPPAGALLDEIAHMAPEDLGIGVDGFQQLRLHL